MRLFLPKLQVLCSYLFIGLPTSPVSRLKEDLKETCSMSCFQGKSQYQDKYINSNSCCYNQYITVLDYCKWWCFKNEMWLSIFFVFLFCKINTWFYKTKSLILHDVLHPVVLTFRRKSRSTIKIQKSIRYLDWNELSWKMLTNI
jgi:hypothetical protein